MQKLSTRDWIVTLTANVSAKKNIRYPLVMRILVTSRTLVFNDLETFNLLLEKETNIELDYVGCVDNVNYI